MRDTGLELIFAVRQAYARCAICISLSLSVGLAQNTPSGPDLFVAVNVTDKSGKPFPGLEEQDFTLFDNKRPQKITSFEARRGSNANQSPPVEVILLLDDVNNAITNVAFERQ